MSEEMPWADYSTSPILVQLKPNGKARIIINLSSPHPKESDKEGKPASVNSGISKEDFPVTMSSTTKFATSLMRAGCPGEMCKLDWNYSAYKHQAVRSEDLKLQVFEFGGRLFGEVMLVFGGVSSAGIYDDMAKVTKGLEILKSSMDKRMVNQHLDDTVGCVAEGDGSVPAFYNAYREVAEEVGVSLANEVDPDKAFNATHEGKVLGVMYNLREWRWWVSEDKLVDIIHKLVNVRNSVKVQNGEMLSLNGKLTHYMNLVPGGAWQRGFLLAMQDKDGNHGAEVIVTDLAREQAAWWLANI